MPIWLKPSRPAHALTELPFNNTLLLLYHKTYILMKNKTTSLFVAVCATAFLYSCNGSMNPAKLFVKKWKTSSVTSPAYDAQMAIAQKAMDTIKDSARRAALKQNIDFSKMRMDAMRTMVLTCNGDGTCETTLNFMGQAKTQKGRWALIDDNKKVVLGGEGSDKSDTLDITELTADGMTVTHTDGKGGVITMTYKSIQ
jgi:hypothetical protein